MIFLHQIDAKGSRQQGELFLNSNALAVSHLTVNDQAVDANVAFKNRMQYSRQPSANALRTIEPSQKGSA